MALSPLQSRIKHYEANETRSKIDTHLQPLFEFVLLLCKNSNFKGADELLLHLIESPSFPKYETFAPIWIIRSEIAEEMDQLQKSVKLFEQAAKYQAQPSMDIINAFAFFQQRHSKHKSQSQKKTLLDPDTPRLPISNQAAIGKNKIEAKLPDKQKKQQQRQQTDSLSSIPVSPILHKQMPCTPLTDDFEHCIFESERKSKQRQKKFHFRSRQNRKQQIVSSYDPPSHHAPQPRSEPKSLSIATVFTKTPLSPILDVTETDMSSSVPPVTPKISTGDHILQGDKDSDNENSMDLSGISDISPIDNIDSSVTFNSPQLPPESPFSTLKSQPVQGNRIEQSTEEQGLEKENVFTFHNLLNEQNKESGEKQ